MATAYRTSLAELDLMDIWGYVAGEDPSAADQCSIESRWLARCSPASRMPDRDAKTSLPDCAFIRSEIISSSTWRAMTVARVIHGARDYRREFE
jgi:plasmid stabilization system protein ParE